jgi:hypothetical protein
MTTELTWFKSSYSSSGGGECLEAAYLRSCSYSDGTTIRTTHIRDSKLGARSPQLVMPAYAWAAFVGHARGV